MKLTQRQVNPDGLTAPLGYISHPFHRFWCDWITLCLLIVGIYATAQSDTEKLDRLVNEGQYAEAIREADFLWGWTKAIQLNSRIRKFYYLFQVETWPEPMTLCVNN